MRNRLPAHACRTSRYVLLARRGGRVSSLSSREPTDNWWSSRAQRRTADGAHAYSARAQHHTARASLAVLELYHPVLRRCPRRRRHDQRWRRLQPTVAVAVASCAARLARRPSLPQLRGERHGCGAIAAAPVLIGCEAREETPAWMRSARLPRCRRSSRAASRARRGERRDRCDGRPAARAGCRAPRRRRANDAGSQAGDMCPFSGATTRRHSIIIGPLLLYGCSSRPGGADELACLLPEAKVSCRGRHEVEHLAPVDTQAA